MKEEELFDPMIEHLKSNGYRILEEHRGREKGIDLVAANGENKIVIELKGDSAAPDVDFGTLIYQIMKRMGNESEKYAIGVSEKYRKHAERCKPPLQKLKIIVYIINEKGVELLF